MSKIIAINSGSSSLKFKIFEMPEEKVISLGRVERIGFDEAILNIDFNGQKITKDIRTDRIIEIHDAVNALAKALVEYGVISDLSEIDAVGHRIVQGGSYFKDSVKVDDDVVKKVDELKILAPLHNPAHLICYREFKKLFPDIDHVFVFDTAFLQTMEPESYLFPVPLEWYTKHQVRRYGAHGISHKFVALRTAELMDKDLKDLNIITCHLGNGASITAIKDGICVNTSMGLTPLGGVMMGTRSGDLDPAIVFHMMKVLDITADRMDYILNKQSGMLGISGISSDARDVLEAADNGNEKAKIAIDIYANRIMNYIGAYAIQLGHVDAITFTAGIAENSYLIREMIFKQISELLGIEIDYDLNRRVFGSETKLSTENSKVQVYLIPANEELVIARDTQRILDL